MMWGISISHFQKRRDLEEQPMKIRRFLPVVAWIALGTGPTWAVDLTKIDRTIPKEPAYQSKSPKYCLLVFGPKAETRVWVVLDLVSEPSEANGAKNALY